MHKLNTHHRTILNSHDKGHITYVIPAYMGDRTTLEYEEQIKSTRTPFLELVQMGYIKYVSRHGHRENYVLTQTGWQTV